MSYNKSVLIENPVFIQYPFLPVLLNPAAKINLKKIPKLPASAGGVASREDA